MRPAARSASGTARARAPAFRFPVQRALAPSHCCLRRGRGASQGASVPVSPPGSQSLLRCLRFWGPGPLPGRRKSMASPSICRSKPASRNFHPPVLGQPRGKFSVKSCPTALVFHPCPGTGSRNPVLHSVRDPAKQRSPDPAPGSRGAQAAGGSGFLPGAQAPRDPGS